MASILDHPQPLVSELAPQLRREDHHIICHSEYILFDDLNKLGERPSWRGGPPVLFTFGKTPGSAYLHVSFNFMGGQQNIHPLRTFSHTNWASS
jgi:hypothetical protein